MRGDTPLPQGQHEETARRWAREAEATGFSIVPTKRYLEYRQSGVPFQDALKTFHRALYLFDQSHGKAPRREH